MFKSTMISAVVDEGSYIWTRQGQGGSVTCGIGLNSYIAIMLLSHDGFRAGTWARFSTKTRARASAGTWASALTTREPLAGDPRDPGGQCVYLETNH